MNKENVTNAKPKIGGAVFIAKLGTELPNSANAKLNNKFENLGYISDKGVVNTNAPKSESVKAWGGDIVLTYQKEKDDIFEIVFLEYLNMNVQKLVFGDENVSGDIKTGITIKHNNSPLNDKAIVIDEILKSGILKRTVIPHATVSDIEKREEKGDGVISIGVKLQGLTDSEGNTHYEYIIDPNADKKNEK